jgi:hypothetical protein
MGKGMNATIPFRRVWKRFNSRGLAPVEFDRFTSTGMRQLGSPAEKDE